MHQGVQRDKNEESIDLTDELESGSDTGASDLSNKEGKLSYRKEKQLKKHYFENVLYWKKVTWLTSLDTMFPLKNTKTYLSLCQAVQIGKPQLPGVVDLRTYNREGYLLFAHQGYKKV